MVKLKGRVPPILFLLSGIGADKAYDKPSLQTASQDDCNSNTNWFYIYELHYLNVKLKESKHRGNENEWSKHQ